MGCEQSTPVSKQLPAVHDEGCVTSTAEDIAERTTSSALATDLKLGMPSCPVRMQYAYYSRTGSDKEPSSRSNQSRFSVSTKFAGDAKDAVLAVYRGHGTAAGSCAEFCRTELPKLLAKHVTRKRMQKYRAVAPPPHYNPSRWPQLSPAEYEECCREAYLECNTNLHGHPTVDATTSGCAATSVHIHGENITVCNVGDCRALLGHVVEDSEGEEKEEIGAERPSNGPLLAIPLTNDHTAHGQDESQRGIKTGRPMESPESQATDERGTPTSNSTSEDDSISGCCLTRSLGDSIAETVGVHAEPEMLTSRLCLNDKVLVIASGAVFKFLSNRAIIRFCADADNAVIASQDIVEAAYDQWMYHEKHADDMTAIVCFLECDRNAGPDTTEELVELAKHSASSGTATTSDSSGGSAGSLSSSPPNSSDVHAVWDELEDVPDVILRL